MKRVGYLWDKMIGVENLYEASRRARKGKRYRESCARFEFRLEKELIQLHEELASKTYYPSTYRSFYIYEPKKRLISAAAYRDRVVHHALTTTLAQVFEPKFIGHSYACRIGKGTHAAVDQCQVNARKYKYVWKADISQFFPSIDHKVLMGLIARKIKDPNVLWLCNRIISTSPASGIRSTLFPGDDLLTKLEHPCGLPIGNQTSQFFANVYMDPLDHFVTEQTQATAYIRYVDDFLVFAHTSSELIRIRKLVGKALEPLRLTLHVKKNTIQRTQDGIRFLGYRVFPTHRLLVKENVDRFVKRMRFVQRNYSAGKIGWDTIRNQMTSWIGHADQADTHRLRCLLFGKIRFTKGVN